MVTRIAREGRRGALITEWAVAMGILVVVMLPLAYSLVQESRLCRAYYYKAVALEIIDGEMEVLAAGEWRAFKSGEQAYALSSRAATNLPPGAFRLTVEEKRLRLDWIPARHGYGGRLTREVKLP
jgi:hypothetical protein